MIHASAQCQCDQSRHQLCLYWDIKVDVILEQHDNSTTRYVMLFCHLIRLIQTHDTAKHFCTHLVFEP